MTTSHASSQASSMPASDAGTVRLSIEHGVATIEFHHPKGNSLPGALLGELADTVTRAGRDDTARVIVLQSGGTGPFCAGASFDELVAIDNPNAGQEFFSGFSRVILAMIRAPKFVVTRVHGRAAGGAVGVIAASDFAIATDNAQAKLSELAVGIGPFVVGPVIERKIGFAAFSAMAVDADWRDASWGERHGLYARVVATTSELDERVQTLARTLAASNPEAMAELKKVFWAGTEEWDSLLSTRAAMSGRMVLSDFTRSAIAKFKAK